MSRARLVAAVAMLLLATASCTGDDVDIPAWANGVSGPAVIDESGLVTEWGYIGYPDESDEFLMRPGRYTGEFGVDATSADSTELIVTWDAVPCQQSPVSRVTATVDKIQIDIYAGPNPNEHCAAASVKHGLRLELTEPLGTRDISASLTDPVNSREILYEQPRLTG